MDSTWLRRFKNRKIGLNRYRSTLEHILYVGGPLKLGVLPVVNSKVDFAQCWVSVSCPRLTPVIAHCLPFCFCPVVNWWCLVDLSTLTIFTYSRNFWTAWGWRASSWVTHHGSLFWITVVTVVCVRRFNLDSVNQLTCHLFIQVYLILTCLNPSIS